MPHLKDEYFSYFVLLNVNEVPDLVPDFVSRYAEQPHKQIWF